MTSNQSEIKKSVLFDDNEIKTRINMANLSKFSFAINRCSAESVTITAEHPRIGEFSASVPILHILELIGGEINTKIMSSSTDNKSKQRKEKKSRKKEISETRKEKKNKKKKKIVWDGPHEGYCHKLVKVDGKDCYTRFNTLQEAKIEAIKLGTNKVGGITLSNGTYSLRTGKTVKSNPASKKKSEKSWLLKEVETGSSDSLAITTEETASPGVDTSQNNETIETLDNNEERENANESPSSTQQDTEEFYSGNDTEQDTQRKNMELLIEMYSSMDMNQIVFSCCEWNYNGKTFTVLDNNILIEKGKFVGQRFYNKNGYTALFMNNYSL